MNRNEQAGQLAAFLAPLLCGAVGTASSPDPTLPPDRDEEVDRGQPDIDLAIRLELQALVSRNPGLLKPSVDGSELDPEQVRDRLSGMLGQRSDHTLGVLWALLAGADSLPRPDILRLAAAPKTEGRPFTKWLNALPTRARDRTLKAWQNRAWLQRNAAGCWMNLLIAAVLATAWWLAWPPPGTPSAGVVALALFSIWCLSFVPGWMYIRFLGQRAGALWDEYVLSLHRLGWDSPGRLPRPPFTSQFYAEWFDDHGVLLAHHPTIYRQKFDAYYGKSVSESSHADGAWVRIETLFPVFLLTVTLAASWTAVLWNPSVADSASSVWDVLKFGFLGAYAFILQMLIRRFFQSDLRPSAYAHAMLRIIVVLIIVTVLCELLPSHSLRTGAVVAFVVGFFPLVGMQALQRCAAAALRVAVPSLSQPYPLSQIDGLTIWYEARLLEAGIEDMQSLATANFVDVILHTRVPVGRLVDWVDQAHLCLQLDRIDHGRFEQWRSRRLADGNPEPSGSSAGNSIVRGSAAETDRAGTRTRTALRQLGIRKATDLLKAFPVETVDPYTRLPSNSPAAAHLRAVQETGLDPAQVRSIVRVLSRNRSLAPVWNWENRGVPQRCARQPFPISPSANGGPRSVRWIEPVTRPLVRSFGRPRRVG
jgi:hypothetical protein